MIYSHMQEINGDALRKAINDRGMTGTGLAQQIEGLNKTYIASAWSYGRIDKGALEKIVTWLDEHNLGLTDEEIKDICKVGEKKDEELKAEAKADSERLGSIEKRLDIIIAKLNELVIAFS